MESSKPVFEARLAGRAKKSCIRELEAGACGDGSSRHGVIGRTGRLW